MALNLPAFCVGLERLSALIATTVDGAMPQRANWHQMLLQQKAAEVPLIRPAVISEGTLDWLDPYRGFRHVVRNVYTFEFDSAKVQKLVEGAPKVFSRLRAELLAFADFLEQWAPAGEQ